MTVTRLIRPGLGSRMQGAITRALRRLASRYLMRDGISLVVPWNMTVEMRSGLPMNLGREREVGLIIYNGERSISRERLGKFDAPSGIFILGSTHII